MYIASRVIIEWRHLISNFIEINGFYEMKDFLIIINFGMAFDSVNHCFY